MNFHIQHAKEGDVLVVRASGAERQLDWAVLHRRLKAPDRSRPTGLLIDLRDRATLPTPLIAERAAAALSALDPAFAAIALVATAGVQFGCARMVEGQCTGEGRPTGVFRSPGEAADWLREQLQGG